MGSESSRRGFIAIVAMARNRVIGSEGKLPWHLSGDLRFFKRETMGHIVVMGRKTYESIGRPLPGRENWVLSRTATFVGTRCIRNMEEISPAADGRKVFVIGGAKIYEALLPLCGEILLTHVDAEPQGDTWFPEFEDDFSEGTFVEAGEGYRIVRYSRLAASAQLVR